MKINKGKLKEKGLKTPTQPDNDFYFRESTEAETQSPNNFNLDEDSPFTQTTQNDSTSNNYEEIPNFGELDEPENPQAPENPQDFGSFTVSDDDMDSYREEVDTYKEKAKPKERNKTRKPSREQTETLDINIDMGKATGNIDGSDFDNHGNLKKKKKKSKKLPLGGLAVLLLLGVIGGGAYAFTNKPVKEAPTEDLTSETPINDPVKDNDEYVPPTEDPNAYIDDVPLDELDLPEDEVDKTQLTPEEVKQQELDKIYEDYLTHTNTYTNFNIKYPNTWYITEKVQESFNEIKLLSKEGVFSFKTAELQKGMSILELNSPDVENTAVVEMIALPKANFDKNQLFTKFQLAEQVVTVQPTQFATETWVTHTVEVAYLLKQEFNLTYLVVQAYETVGSNILMYTFKEPFFDTAEFVADEEEQKEGTENTTETEDKQLTIEEIKELTPSLEVYKNIVTSVEVQ